MNELLSGNGFSTYCMVGQGPVYFLGVDSHIFSRLSLPFVTAKMCEERFSQFHLQLVETTLSLLVIFWKSVWSHANMNLV